MATKPATVHTCVIKSLPIHQLIDAAAEAVRINPANAPFVHGPARAPRTPERIAGETGKFWGKVVDLGVQFMDTANAAVKAKILAHMNEWGKYGSIRFRESASGQIRIILSGDGYYSYVGTDALSIPSNQETMCLQGFSMQTPDSEWKRVVYHETGHALGFIHEHMRPEIVARLDPAKTIAEFRRLYGWDEQTTREQVLTPIDPRKLTALPADINSIMCYQLGAACTVDGKPIPGGLTIDPEDGQLAARLYPPTSAPVTVIVPGLVGNGATWDSARRALTNVGLVIAPPSVSDPTAKVTGQSPVQGTSLPIGGTVAVQLDTPAPAGVRILLDLPNALPGTKGTATVQ